MDKFSGFLKFIFTIGCMVFTIVGVICLCLLVLGLTSIPYNQTQCRLASEKLETRFEFFGGCFVKDQKTGVYMEYDKWEDNNGTLDIK